MPDDLQIRPAVESDVELIHAFILELAEYEKLSGEVAATPALLRHSLFGENPAARALIASASGEPAGFALYFTNYSTFLGRPGIYIEDLFVRERYRSMGIGRALLAHLAAIATSRGYGRMEWWVLDWNEPAIRFYESLGAQPMKEWSVHRLSGEALQQLAAKAGAVGRGS